MTDARTGKQYIVLETSTLNFDENIATCARYNAILPEPKTEEENNFLDSLDAETFPLGRKFIVNIDGQSLSLFPFATKLKQIGGDYTPSWLTLR